MSVVYVIVRGVERMERAREDHDAIMIRHLCHVEHIGSQAIFDKFKFRPSTHRWPLSYTGKNINPETFLAERPRFDYKFLKVVQFCFFFTQLK